MGMLRLTQQRLFLCSSHFVNDRLMARHTFLSAAASIASLRCIGAVTAAADGVTTTTAECSEGTN
jgi:hypothetical protein